MSLEESINKWHDYLLIDKKYSQNTIKTYENNLKNFKKFVGESKEVSKITKEDIINYITKLKKNNNKDYTIANCITSLKQFFHFLVLEKEIEINPVKSIAQPKMTRKLPSVLSIKEVTKLLDVDIKNKYDARNKAMLETLYSSGLRISELLSLKVDDISFSSDNVRVLGKGNKERFVPLGDYAIKALKSYLDVYREQFIKKPTSYLFLSNQGKPLTRQRMYQYIKELAIKKNIKTEFSLHTLRHSFASHMLQNGADLRSIQEMLGHSSISTTQIYTHVASQELANKYNMFHPHA